jgi:hypothetical protein
MYAHMEPFQATTEITTDDFISCYQHTHEKTSSSPSGQHVGHYKAACRDPTIAYLHSKMMSIPFMAGFATQRWRKVIEVMLQKDPGCPRIHRLQIIALLESDFNQAVRILIARQLGHHMEDNQLVPDMQYGSQEGRQCISAVLNKQLTHDII